MASCDVVGCGIAVSVLAYCTGVCGFAIGVVYRRLQCDVVVGRQGVLTVVIASVLRDGMACLRDYAHMRGGGNANARHRQMPVSRVLILIADGIAYRSWSKYTTSGRVFHPWCFQNRLPSSLSATTRIPTLTMPTA